MDEAFAKRGGFSRRRQHDGMREPGVCVHERIELLQTVDVARLACTEIEMNGLVHVRLDRPAHDRQDRCQAGAAANGENGAGMIFRSEEHTSELQSLMRISYAAF